MTREEFIGIAADAILRAHGHDPAGACPGFTRCQAVEDATAALEAVGAYEMRALLAEAVEMGMPYGASWFGQHGWTARVKSVLTGEPVPDPGISL